MNSLNKNINPAYFYIIMLLFVSFANHYFTLVSQPAFPEYYLGPIGKDKPVANETIKKPVPAISAIKERAVDDIKNCACATTFKKSYPVVWSGKVIATFVGGLDLGVKSFDQTAKYKDFYVVGNGKYKSEMGDKVRIKGQLVGLTCAYANTVFGKCVGEVEAQEISAIK